MKLAINLNEAHCGFAGCLGVYLILMQSDQDGGLFWPFPKRFTFVLFDQQDDPSQRQNISYTAFPCGELEFQRPRQRENVGWGETQFVKHSILRARQYVTIIAIANVNAHTFIPERN